MDKPDLSNKSTYVKIKEACEYILDSGGKKDQKNNLSSAELFEKVKVEFPDDFPPDFVKNTFYQYLSNSVKDPESSINCLGRRKGYYLSDLAEEAKKEEVEEAAEPTAADLGEAVTIEGEETPSVKKAQKEILLYPLLESWLVAQGYQAQDVSSGRSLGKWGNPDVAGISALDAFNGLSIELVTVEAKVSVDNWEQWIFEAISHRRFANRSYFAFAHPEETVSKIPQDMRYYAELYNIGVLVLSMDNDKYKNLQAGKLADPLDSEDVEVIEVFSAPYNFVQPKYQLKFCEALGISCLKQLYRWGRTEE
jgi:hypothetical protein